MKRQIRLITIVAAALLAPAFAAAQDSLGTARDLYAAAEYESALQILNRLRTTPQSTVDLRGIEQYRAFCLLALGRTSDAEHAIEAVVAAEPLYLPTDVDMSPRLRSAFTDVRKRMLPGIIQDLYNRAKAAYDQKNYAFAAQTFKDMLATLNDPAVGPAANQPPLSDLKMLATGFYDLSAAAIAPPAPPKPAPPPVMAVAPPSIPPPVVQKIYSAADSGVQPPSTIRQSLPEYDKRLGNPTGQALLEIVIDESGNVELAMLRGSINPQYDALAVEAARKWRYKPATVNGTPVKFSKSIAINVKLMP
jgi:protein TonB